MADHDTHDDETYLPLPLTFPMSFVFYDADAYEFSTWAVLKKLAAVAYGYWP